MLSFAIPLYNKRAFIEKTIQSCIQACELCSIKHEVIITNNASTDASNSELDMLAAKYQGCRVIHLPRTISASENWLFSLNNCHGTYIKLLLADDLMPAYDLKKGMKLMENGTADYIIGRTEPVFEAKGFSTNYFGLVSSFRKQIHSAMSAPEKVAMVLEHIAHSTNPFGDIGALMFHRKCLKSLNLGVWAGLPAFTTFPDLDIYLTLFAHHRGAYLDETVSHFVYNKTSPAVRRVSDSELQVHGLYAEYEAMMPLYFISSFKLKPLTDLLSLDQKQLFLRASQGHMSRLLGISDAHDENTNQGRLIPQHKTSLWLSRIFFGRVARSIARRLKGDTQDVK